jgi:hypothetical protein
VTAVEGDGTIVEIQHKEKVAEGCKASYVATGVWWVWVFAKDDAVSEANGRGAWSVFSHSADLRSESPSHAESCSDSGTVLSRDG